MKNLFQGSTQKEIKMQTELEKRNILRRNGAESNAITKECIESALILLMQEKSFSEISIQEIIRRAGVGRSSYYRNYKSKEAILESKLDSMIKEVLDSFGKFDFSVESPESWLTVLKMAKKHSQEYKLLLDAGFGDKILRKIIETFKNNPNNDEEIRITDIYIAGSIYSVMTQWILDGMKTDESKIANICCSLMFKGMKTVYKCEH